MTIKFHNHKDIINTINDAVIVFDNKLNIVYINNLGKSLFKLNKKTNNLASLFNKEIITVIKQKSSIFNQYKNITPVDLHNEFGIPEGNKVICNIGNLSAHKNIPMYIDAAKKVLSESHNISFLYIGDGEDLEKYKNEIIKRR